MPWLFPLPPQDLKHFSCLRTSEKIFFKEIKVLEGNKKICWLIRQETSLKQSIAQPHFRPNFVHSSLIQNCPWYSFTLKARVKCKKESLWLHLLYISKFLWLFHYLRSSSMDEKKSLPPIIIKLYPDEPSHSTLLHAHFNLKENNLILYMWWGEKSRFHFPPNLEDGWNSDWQDF